MGGRPQNRPKLNPPDRRRRQQSPQAETESAGGPRSQIPARQGHRREAQATRFLHRTGRRRNPRRRLPLRGQVCSRKRQAREPDPHMDRPAALSPEAGRPRKPFDRETTARAPARQPLPHAQAGPQRRTWLRGHPLQREPGPPTAPPGRRAPPDPLPHRECIPPDRQDPRSCRGVRSARTRCRSAWPSTARAITERRSAWGVRSNPQDERNSAQRKQQCGFWSKTKRAAGAPTRSGLNSMTAEASSLSPSCCATSVNGCGISPTPSNASGLSPRSARELSTSLTHRFSPSFPGAAPPDCRYRRHSAPGLHFCVLHGGRNATYFWRARRSQSPSSSRALIATGSGQRHGAREQVVIGPGSLTRRKRAD